jgi:hypothetical protein
MEKELTEVLVGRYFRQSHNQEYLIQKDGFPPNDIIIIKY